jgi:hypothetical protein
MNLKQTMAIVVVALCAMMFPGGVGMAADGPGATITDYRRAEARDTVIMDYLKNLVEQLTIERAQIRQVIQDMAARQTTGGSAAKVKGKGKK